MYKPKTYKIGTKIRIKKNLVVGNKYGHCYFVREMRKYLGKQAVITNVNRKLNYYELGLDDGVWNWTEEMFRKPTVHTKAYLEKKGKQLGEGKSIFYGGFTLKDWDKDSKSKQECKHKWQVDKLVSGDLFYGTMHHYVSICLKCLEKKYI